MRLHTKHFVRKLEGNQPLGRHGPRWQDNMTMNPKEIRHEDK
jgi:hypothetical protein